MAVHYGQPGRRTPIGFWYPGAFLVSQRKDNGLAKSTVQRKAWTLAEFYTFLLVRYQGDIHALTGCVVVVRWVAGDVAAGAEVPARCAGLSDRVVVAAGRAGLRIGETVMLDIRDWSDPDAPLLPSERRDPHTGRCGRVVTTRCALAWPERSYEQGLDIKAIQELLGCSAARSRLAVHNDSVHPRP